MANAPCYHASDRALLTELGDGTGVLLDLDSKFYFSLNETAIFVWKQLSTDTGLSRAELSRRLCHEFEVAEDEAEADLDTVLQTLVKERLIKAVAAGT